MTCPGGALDSSCFGLTGPCPDFGSCYLRALGLSINSSSVLNIPLLQVGMGNDAGLGIVNFGAYPSKVINTFTVYANQTFSVRTINTPLDLVSYFADSNLDSVGGATVRTFVTSTGQVGIRGDVGVTMSAPTGNVLISAGATSILLNQIADTVTVQTTNTSYFSGDFSLFRSAGVPWFQTRSWETLTCSNAGPLVPTSGTSLRFSHDVILTNGAQIKSDAASGLVSMAGIDLCGDLLKTTGPTLQLQTSTATKTIDMRGVITNGDFGYAVTIINQEGVNFQDTAIHNELGVPGPLVCDDTEGLTLTANNTLFVNTIMPVNATANGTVFIIGDLNVTGTIYGAVAVASPACCTSDVRAKTNITEVDSERDLFSILALPRRVDFQYTEEYQASDKSVDNSTYSGFIAQELEKAMPRTVTMSNHKINGQLYSDFRKVVLDRMVPHMVGAIKELHKRQVQLEIELVEMRETLNRLAAKL